LSQEALISPAEESKAMRTSITRAILLPSIAVLLGAYYVLFEHVASQEPQPPSPPHLFRGLVSERITKLEMRTADKELTAVKEEGLWMLKKPQSALADQAEIARLISILQQAEYTRKLEIAQAGRQPGQYGLTNPNLTVSVWSREPKTQRRMDQTMLFGATSPSGTRAYASAHGSDELLLIDAEIVNQIKYFLFVPPLQRKSRARHPGP